MCGINGFTGEPNASRAHAMNAALAHRGPDGVRVEEFPKATLGFARLAIIDLDARAMQPMADASGRYTLVFNGEIYNFKELKQELAGYPWKSEGDSEVILAGYARWGTGVFSRLNGMFALALYDREREELVLARDTGGIKPLFYSAEKDNLIFSSEIPALFAAGVPRTLNPEAIGHYLRLKYVPGPMTLIQGVSSLTPGSILSWKNGSYTVTPFSFTAAVPAFSSYAEARSAVRRTVEAAVSRQLVSDRPVGLYLSGGIDSSVVLACASAVHPALNTFSVGFDLSDGEERAKFNADSELARETARHFGAAHHEYLLSSDDVLSLFPEMLSRMSMPIGNPTTLAQLFLAKETKSRATVVLSGEGGDELFGGYERYRLALQAAHLARFTPAFLDAFLPGSLSTLHARGLKRFAQLMYEKKSEFSQVLMPGIDLANTSDLFRHYFTGGDIAEELMRADESGWLVGEALLRADNMSMGASLEARVPLLDEEVKALAHALPRAYKVDGSQTKKILKDAFSDILSPAILSQPKRGWFSPGAKWLRRPDIETYARDVFSDPGVFSGFFDTDKICALYDDHVGGGYHATLLWSLLVLFAWAREHKLSLA